VNVLHVTTDSFHSAVLDSQVVMSIRHLRKYLPAARAGVLLMCRYDEMLRRDYPIRRDSLRLGLLPSPLEVNGPLMPFLLGQKGLLARSLHGAVRRMFPGGAPVLVHCRGYRAAAVAARARRFDARIRILFDVRGHYLDEFERGSAPRGIRSPLRTALKRDLARAWREADAITTVSTPLAREMDRLFGARRVPRAVVPGGVDLEQFHYSKSARERARSRHGLAERFVVTYCGSADRWYTEPRSIVRAFASIRRDNDDAHLLIITPNPGILEKVLRSEAIATSDYTVTASTHGEVAGLLSAGDLGLLIRNDSLTNHCAAPTKLAEYLACGVPVLISDTVDDYARLVSGKDVGVSIAYPLSDTAIIEKVRLLRQRLRRDGERYRQHCGQVARSHLSWDRLITHLARLYAQACEPNDGIDRG